MSTDDAGGHDDAVEGFRRRRLKGMRIRDEFLCPITQELLREPVVVSDGHTYEKAAIEKWLRSKNISPMTGEEMRDKNIIGNVNLKKLIKDLIEEGGAGLYTTDLTNQSRLFDVSPEKVLLLKCLGPPESDWNQQIFQVSPVGCFGGRKLQDLAPGRDLMLFRDTTVSRKHFEITATPDYQYFLRDLGSAGGTFIRIAVGERKLLHPGTILLMGKHQFLVSSVDESSSKHNNNTLPMTPASQSATIGTLDTNTNESAELHPADEIKHEQAVLSLMSDAEQLLGVLEVPGNKKVSESKTLGQRMRSFHERVTALVTGADPSAVAEQKTPKDLIASRPETKVGRRHDENCIDEMVADEVNDGIATLESNRGVLKRENTKNCMSASLTVEDQDKDKDPAAQRRRSSFFRDTRKCTITCFTPDGSPLQGVSFVVGPQGGTVGRKPNNTIALCITHPAEGTGADAAAGPRITHIDSAVSGEHARIDMDPNTGDFYITDGVLGKPSTNGTWYRLSGPYQESPPHSVHGSMEVLIGTIRFQVSESMTIAEHAVLI